MTDFVRLAEVKRTTGLSKTEIYRRINAGEFPKSIRLGHRTAVWLSDEIRAWKERVIAEAKRSEKLNPGTL